MIDRVSSAPGWLAASPTRSPTRFVLGVTEKPEPEAEPAELSAPEGDEATLAREFRLLDAANRWFSRLLPQIELLTASVE